MEDVKLKTVAEDVIILAAALLLLFVAIVYMILNMALFIIPAKTFVNGYILESIVAWVFASVSVSAQLVLWETVGVLTLEAD